jgi:hypothetical protein
MMFTGVPKLGGDLVACSKKCAVAMEETVGNLGIMIMQKLQTVQHQFQFSWIGGQHMAIMLLTEAKTMKAKPERHLQRSPRRIWQRKPLLPKSSLKWAQQQLNGVQPMNGPKPLVLG